MTIRKCKEFVFQLSKRIITYRIENIFKSIYLLIKILKERKQFSKKIKNVLQGHRTRKIIKPYRFVQFLLNNRIIACNKIKDAFKVMLYRKKVKKILNRLEEYNIIYSTIQSKLLIFIVQYENGLEENLFFEYNNILKCNLLFICKTDNLCKKKIKGYFMTDSEYHILDNNYPIENDKNIIDIANILKLYNELDFDYENIGKKFLSKNKKIYSPFRRRLRSQTLGSNTILKFSTNKEYNSSTSLNIFKSILKPTRSFKTFKKENRRISFGSIEIMAV